MTFYYPILKKGNSEIIALENLPDDFKKTDSNICPLIEAPQKSNPDNWEKDFNTFGTYLSRKIPTLKFAFQYSTAFSQLDTDIVSTWQSDDGLNIVEYIHNRLSTGYGNYIPCFNYDDPDWILDSIPFDFITKIIVRREPHKFESGLDNIIISGIKSKFLTKFPGKKIIWLLDFYNSFSELERVTTMISLIDTNQAGENIIFGATSCPEDANSINHSNFSVASTRNDLSSFLALKEQFISLSFADYTVRLKPAPTTEQRSRINMNNTYLKIFYSTDKHYMIAKSGLISRQGKEQSNHLTLQEICKKLIHSPHYFGKDYSWGDKKIYECAINEIEINDHQVPIQIGINHHLVTTINQL